MKIKKFKLFEKYNSYEELEDFFLKLKKLLKNQKIILEY